ncbi:MAG: VWA domain-containing protein [Caldilineaceae bacterium]|nr:VWA domain-containing protein [Caldilineaceae bacterium]
MFNPYVFDNSRGDGFPVLEIVTADSAPRRFVPLQRTELTGTVTGPVADLRLTQRFGFSAEQSSAVVEALYRFPLPGDAAVRGVEVRFGDVTITASLKPRAEAEADYAAAKEAGKQAALATRGGADTFTLRVAGIRPGEPVTVVTRYVQLAQADGLGWSLRTPLTLAPRYVRQDEAQGRASEQLPLGVMRDPGHRFALDVTVVGAESVASPTHEVTLHGVTLHEVKMTPGEAGVQVQLAAGEVTPERDLLLRWTLPQAEARPGLHVLAHNDPAAGYLYFLAQIAAPRAAGTGLRREITLLVDHSGSMSGPKWEAADWATEQLLRSLTAQDAFALGVFHNTAAWFAPQLQPGDAATVERALSWFKARRDSGGTELGVALEQALRLAQGAGEAARAVLVVTDAQVTDHARLFQLAEREFAAAQRRRISVLCIDSAPNDYLARQLAERGGGVARFLTSDPDQEDITTALDAVLADWAAPALAGLRLVLGRGEVHAVQHRVLAARPGEAAVDLGDLPAGRVVWAAGRAPRGAQPDLALALEGADGAPIAAAGVRAGDYPALAALFAAHRIGELDYLIHAYTLSPEEIAARVADLGFAVDALAGVQTGTAEAIYAENRKTVWHDALTALIQAESLAFGIPSSETAFVAVRQEAGRPVTQVVPVANALAEGWSNEFVGMRPMAAPSGKRAALARGALPASLSTSYMLHNAPMSALPSLSLPAQARSDASVSGPAAGQARLFAGALAALLQQRVLLDTGDQPKALPAPVTLTGVSWSGDAAAQQALAQAGDLALAIYAGDMAAPRARVRLRDLAAAGRRPLNLRCRRGERVRVLVEGQPSAAFAQHGGQMELRLAW